MVAVTSYRHPRFGELMTSYSEVVQHVVNHGTYHCGNLTAMLRQMGYAGVPTDCEFFLFDQNNNGDS
nr:DinB family protein [Brevibacillus humidisoli]